MKEGETDWVSLQVPDGTDWLEYMLNQPQHPDLRATGVMNHISLGVADIKKAQAILESHNWKPHGDEKAQLGKDGKYQGDAGERSVLSPEKSMMLLIPAAQTLTPSSMY